MQSTSSEPSSASTIIRTGSDGRLRYSREQRQDLPEAFDRSSLSAMSFSRQHGVSYQTFITHHARASQPVPPWPRHVGEWHVSAEILPSPRIRLESHEKKRFF